MSDRLLRRGIVAAAAATLVGASVALLSMTGEEVPSSPLLAPTGEGPLFGVQYDWTEDTVAGYADRLGEVPAVAGVFVAIPFDDFGYATLDQAALEALDEGAALMVTLEPDRGLEAVDGQALDELTTWLRRWNDRGLTVIVRYAHEMNGDWYPWGQRPEAYVASFREVAAAVRAAPTSEIMWAPNEASGYPFDGDRPTVDGSPEGGVTPDPGAAGADGLPADPYAPYYPGDDHVDWVGLTAYHFGSQPPWGDNEVPADDSLLGRITGQGARTADGSGVPDFHAEYVVGRGKPFALAETAALYVPDARPSGDDQSAIVAAWAGQVFDRRTIDALPGLDLVMWFEFRKPEEAVLGETIDWRATADDQVREAFRGALSEVVEFGGNDGHQASARTGSTG